MGLNLTSIARIQPSVQDQNVASRPYSVHWSDNADLKDWTTFINLDIVGAWNSFLFGTKRTPSGGFIQPTNDFPPIDSLVNDRILFRLRYDKHPKNKNPTTFGKIQWTTTADALFSDDRSITFPLIADEGFKLYELDMNQSSKWTGLISSVRFFPCEDGAINDEFFLNFFEIGTNNVEFQLDNINAGAAARLVADTPLLTDVSIVKDFNDRLLVNLDGYGFIDIRLTPQVAAPAIVARDLSVQLSKIAIGGYIRATAFIDSESRKLIIESGTKAANSSVAIAVGENSAANSLGLANLGGALTVSNESGADPAPSFVPVSAYRPTTFELLNFLDSANNDIAFTLDPEIIVIEGGRRDFGTVTKSLSTEIVVEGRGTTFEGTKITVNGTVGAPGLTFIDLNHPFTDDGLIEEISFNGVADESGASKWKVFRPLQDGNLSLVAEGVIGQRTIVDNPNNGLVLTTEPGVYRQNVSGQNVRVRRGDLIGIYNVGMHLGTGRTDKPDALFYQISGDAQGTITPSVPVGAGDGGIPVYAVGKARRSQSVIDIDFGKRVNLDTVTLFGEESNNDLEFNVSVANSASITADTKGSHTICYVADPFNNFRDCFSRNNAVFNIQALNDGIRFADNGISAFGSPGLTGAGGATVQGATYFYVNGDEEFLGVHDFAGADPKAYGFDRDALGITVFFSSSTPRLDKNISRAVMYFKDPKNMRSWQIETARGQGNAGGNGSINGFDTIPQETISAIQFDDKRVERGGFVFTQKNAATQTILLNNPAILDVISKSGVRNPQKGVDFTSTPNEIGGVNIADQATFINTQWTRFQWEFTPIRTTGFRWFSDYHFSTKISELEVYASAPAKESLGDNIQVLFSSDGESFASAEVLGSNTEFAEFQLGNSPRFMRIVFRPSRQFFAKRLQFNFEQDEILFGQEGRIVGATAVDEARVGSVGAPTRIPITNNTGTVSDLLIDIPIDDGPSKELLYFSHLNEAVDVSNPQIGGPGRVNFDSDLPLLETENAAINATAYGLKNLVSSEGSASTTPNLVLNGGFETGDLTGWHLSVTQSGSKIFQQPYVYAPNQADTPTFDPSFYTSDGSFSFGFSIDSRVPEQIGQSTPVVFSLETDAIDVTEFASSIDLGSAEAVISFKYAAAYTPQEVGPLFSLIGSPTLSGLGLSPGAVVSADYGSNLLRQKTFTQSNVALIQTADDIPVISNFKINVKEDTRFIKLRFDVVASGSRTTGSVLTEKFFLDSVDAKLNLQNANAVRWYKSWRLGQGDFTDANFSPVTEYLQTIGSHHWWQPFRLSANTGVPIAGQAPGFSNVFTNDRTKGIQAFSRTTLADPGILGCKWSGEKRIAGFRIGLGNNTLAGTTNGSCAYPRFWFVQVLKTRVELSGSEPDLNNPSHFNFVRAFQQTGPWTSPNAELINNTSTSLAKSPSALITSWLFDAPVLTEGIKLVFTLACDVFEKNLYGPAGLAGAVFTSFNSATTCPDNVGGPPGFTCSFGLSATFFQPLEALGNKSLPVDNIKETIQPNSNVYAAVDLRRLRALDTDSRVFELLLDSFNNTDWLPESSLFSNSATDDPNLVVWGNSSAQNARWIRFSSLATEKYEDPASLVMTSTTPTDFGEVAVRVIPQGIIRSARIYPDITISSIHTVGFNAEWENLGTTVTDNDNSTFIHYSDFPVIAIDLGDTFILQDVATDFRPIHDVLAGRGNLDNADKAFWQANVNANFTYSSHSFRAAANPQQVSFLPFGSTAPAIAVRWVALRGGSNLRNTSSTFPRGYLIKTQGGRLFDSFWRPKFQDPITDHPSWFRTKSTGLVDVSSIKSEIGNTFSAAEGLDFGANATNMGTAYFAFDGTFTPIKGDIWGVQVRDVFGKVVPAFDFPHKIFRLFRDTFTGTIQTKNIVAFKLKGFNEIFFPTTFKLQKLKANVMLANGITAAIATANAALLSNDLSWEDVTGTSFTGVDTYQSGNGFTAILDGPTPARAFRIFITNSEFPDDSTLTQTNEVGGFGTFVDISGPQTRVAEVVFYEAGLIEEKVQGLIEVDHALTATVSATSEVEVNPAGNVNDGNISTFWQSKGLRETLTIKLSAPRPITRLEWTKDPNLGRASGLLSTNAPQDFVLKALFPGQLPVVVLSQTGFIGENFVGILTGAPITTDTFVLQITKVQGENESASSIQISELKLIEEFIQETPLVIMSKVADSPNGNAPSTLITYAANSEATGTITVDGMDAGSDPSFSERDFFEFDFKVNDLSLFDTSFGSIKLGNSKEISYRWDFSSIPNLHSGWNTLRLQFKNASDRAAVPVQGGPNFNVNTDSSRVDFTTQDAELSTFEDGNSSQRLVQAPGIRFFQIEFKGTKVVPDKELELTLHNFHFSRNKFNDLCKFNTGIYLNNSEVLQPSIENIDISTGTVEFWFQPDWDFNGIIPSRGRFIPSLFRVVQQDGKFINFFYRPGTGFVFLVFDGVSVRQYETTVQQHPFVRYQTFHLKVIWDSRARIGREGMGVNILFNGQTVFGSRVTWDAPRQGRGNFVVGGEFSQTLVANPFNSTALAFTTVPTLPAKHTASAWGLVENLKVYNYIKTDNSDIFDFDITRSSVITPNKLIEVSLDGVNFEKVGSQNLPISVTDVVPNQVINLYVRTNIPKNLSGDENRDASILVTWRTPRSQCG